MTGDKSLDLVGVGRLAKAIPPAAWKRVVETACSTFENVVAPVTATTSGIGRLIAARFDRLVEAEKVIVAKTAEAAHEKVEKSGELRNSSFNFLVLCKVIEHAQSQAEPSIRELWSNLLAREMTQGSVHPEIADVLARLTTNDAVLLLEIANKMKNKDTQLFRSVASLTSSLSLHFVKITRTEPSTMNHTILDRLGLIRNTDLGWELTAFGVAFLETVTPLQHVGGKKQP